MVTSEMGKWSATAFVSDLEGDGHRFVQQTGLLGSIVAYCTTFKNGPEGFLFFLFCLFRIFFINKSVQARVWSKKSYRGRAWHEN